MGYKKSADGHQVLALRDLQLGQDRFLRLDNGTAPMNVNGEAGGTPSNVWNGTGGADTGADWSPNGIGSEGAASMHSGTNGWDTGVSTATNELTRFTDGGGDSDIVGTYDELRFWMQPKAFPAGSRLRLDWQDGSNTLIGDPVNVRDYVTNFDLDVWQQVAIPIADFNLTGDVSKLRFRYRQQVGQQFYFDDIQLVPAGSGGPYRFRVVAPDANTRYHISMLVLVLSAPSSGWNASAFANISGGLSKGLLIRQRRLSDAEILWTLNSKDNLDLFGRFHPQDDITFANGDLLVGFMIKPGMASVVITNDEVLEFVVRDDLSSLSECRAYAHFGIETVES